MAGRDSPGPPGIQSGLEVMTGTGRRKEIRKMGLPMTTLPGGVSLGCSGRIGRGPGSDSPWFLENLSSPSLSHWEAEGPNPVDKRSRPRKYQSPYTATSLIWTPSLGKLVNEIFEKLYDD